jgi:hypothetical protein
MFGVKRLSEPFHFLGGVIDKLKHARADRVGAIAQDIADRRDDAPHAAAHIVELVRELAGCDRPLLVGATIKKASGLGDCLGAFGFDAVENPHRQFTVDSSLTKRFNYRARALGRLSCGM